jgi:APA family basic amino acid/polyamine antiporter
MARGGAFWAGAGALGRSGAPTRALWLQAAVTAALVLSGTFERLQELASLAMIATACLTVTALFVLRRRLPDAPRPYRATGYPWLPGLFLASGAVSAAIMIGRAAQGEEGAAYPLIGLAVGVAAWAARAWRLRASVAR